MPSFLSIALPLVLAGGALANPLLRRDDDQCLAAVTGSAALGDAQLRQDHCSSYFKTIVTPAAITTTTTVTGASASVTGWQKWKRDSVTVCPNEVPNYASACTNTDMYASACSVWGISSSTTITIPATTTTKTVYLATPLNNICTSTVTLSGCSGGTTTETVTSTETATTSVATVTVSVTAAPVTVTVTASSSYSGLSSISTGAPGSSIGPGFNATNVCLTDDTAQTFVDAFTTLLEYTSYAGNEGPPGRGYRYDVSAQYLAVDFTDYSDSINWMAGFPLGGVTFGSRAAFDYGQGILQPELAMTTLNVSHSCNTITWRWHATTSSYASVIGINHMVLTSDLSQIQTNYAEFNNGVWINSFGLQCNLNAVSSNTTSSTSSSNSTAPASRMARRKF